MWDPMTQLMAHAFMEAPPPRAKKIPPPMRKNNVRMVGIMRRTKSAHAWK